MDILEKGNRCLVHCCAPVWGLGGPYDDDIDEMRFLSYVMSWALMVWSVYAFIEFMPVDTFPDLFAKTGI